MILITGAAGYIGSYLIEKIANQIGTENIRAVDSFETGSVKQIGNVSVQYCDLTNENEVKQIVEDVDVIVHCAAISDIPTCEQNSDRAVRSNLLSIWHLLEEGRKHQLKRIIFPSSFAVYSPGQEYINEDAEVRPYNLYGFLKYWSEQLIKSYSVNHGIDYVIFRQTNVSGRALTGKNTVIQAMCRSARTGGPLTIFGDGLQVRNFIHINDLANIYESALYENNGIYNLAGPETKSIKEIAEQVASVADKEWGKKIEIIYKDSDRKNKEPTTETFTYDISKLKRDFDDEPKTTVRETIEELLRE